MDATADHTNTAETKRLLAPFARANSGEITLLSTKSGLAARFILRPPQTRFAFGFFTDSQGTFVLAIYIYPPRRDAHHRRRVWCATDERRAPVSVRENASLQLTSRRGLVLLDHTGRQVWSAASRSRGAYLQLGEDGNLVLRDASGCTVWESFDYPVDAMLPGQILTQGMSLINGPYKLQMEARGLVLYLGTSEMWTWDTCKNSSCTAGEAHAEFSTRGLQLIPIINTSSCECTNKFFNPIKVLQGHVPLALLLRDNGAIHVDVLCSRDPPRRTKGKHHTYQLPNSGGFPCSVCKDSFCLCPRNADKNAVHSEAYWLPSTSLLHGRKLLSKFSFRKHATHKYKAVTVGFAGLLGAATIGIVAAICAEKKKPPVKPQNDIKHILPAVIPQKFSYSSIRKITDNFSKQLGDGGFGGVYEGRLKDETKVAVKVLEHTSTQGEKEFKAEMTTMATIRHMNILQLRGYCAERKHRVLVYDFMPNGSLDRWLFSAPGKDGILDWAKRFSVAVGTAKGLAYLHEECNQQIIHLDVKPENILLDHNYVAKVADFGLSKLIDRDKSKVVTNMRGTPGYLAPEWMHQAAVTSKADVYSYGMVLLELICGRETIDLTKGSEQWYLPAWAVRMVEEGRTLELVDNHLHEEIEYFYSDDAKRSIRTALCCIQEDPSLRPRMSKVVQMLEGVVEPKLPQLTRLPLQPATAASRLKDRLAALAESISREDSLNAFGANEQVRAVEELSFNAWGLNGVAGQTRTVLKARNQPCIPPWPLKGDIVVVRGSGKGGEFAHAVIRDVKIRTQQVRLALLHKIEDNRWGVSEEEGVWRQWSVMVRTLQFWTPIKSTTLPGYGPQIFPVEWAVADHQSA